MEIDTEHSLAHSITLLFNKSKYFPRWTKKLLTSSQLNARQIFANLLADCQNTGILLNICKHFVATVVVANAIQFTFFQQWDFANIPLVRPSFILHIQQYEFCATTRKFISQIDSRWPESIETFWHKCDFVAKF